MEITRFDLQNQAIQRRIADALERIVGHLEIGDEFGPKILKVATEAYKEGFKTARAMPAGVDINQTFDKNLDKFLKRIGFHEVPEDENPTNPKR